MHFLVLILCSNINCSCTNFRCTALILKVCLSSYFSIYHFFCDCYCYRTSRRPPPPSEGSTSPPPPPPPPPPPGSRHTLGSPRNSPRLNRKHHQASNSLATTPTQSTLSPEFMPDGFPSSGSKTNGLDRVLLERNLEKLLQDRSSHPEENGNELGR